MNIKNTPADTVCCVSLANMKEYSFSTYNIFKNQFPSCEKTVRKLCDDNDFLAIQEWVSSLHFETKNYVVTCPVFTIPIRNIQTGTATFSKFPIVSTSQFFSKTRELGFATRKSMIVSTYIVDGTTLSIFNCHALNFVTNKIWYRTIDYWISQIPKEGGVIFAGDFNTWNHWRFEYLEKNLETLGLNYAHYNNSLILKLDHIFTRGINVTSTVLNDKIKTSDHFPITLHFTIEK